MKDKDEVTISVIDNNGDEHEVKLKVEIKKRLITTKRDYQLVSNKILDRMYQEAKYHFDENLLSIKIKDVTLLFREDMNQNYTDQIYNRMVGTFELEYVDGSIDYLCVVQDNVVVDEENKAVMVEGSQYCEQERFASIDDAKKTMFDDDYKTMTLPIKNYKLGGITKDVTTDAIGKHKEELEGAMNTSLNTSLEADYKEYNVKSYELKQMYFGYRSDRQKLYADTRFNGLVGIYEVTLKDGTSRYLGYMIHDVKYGNEDALDFEAFYFNNDISQLANTPEELVLEFERNGYDLERVDF